MKKILLFIAVAAALLCASNVKAQTDLQGGIKQLVADFTSGTNAAIEMAIGRSSGHMFSGQGKTVAGVFLFYGLQPSTNGVQMGLVVGNDWLWTKGAQIQNSVNGGVNISLPMKLLTWTGIPYVTNLVTEPHMEDLIATPSGNNPIGNIVNTGFDFKVVTLNNVWTVDIGINYADRQGQGMWDGAYWVLNGGLQFNF